MDLYRKIGGKYCSSKVSIERGEWESKTENRSRLHSTSDWLSEKRVHGQAGIRRCQYGEHVPNPSYSPAGLEMVQFHSTRGGGKLEMVGMLLFDEIVSSRLLDIMSRILVPYHIMSAKKNHKSFPLS